jgi:hypothetical protein
MLMIIAIFFIFLHMIATLAKLLNISKKTVVGGGSVEN